MNLLDHPLDEFIGLVAPFGLREPDARRLFAHLHAHGRREIAGGRGLSPRALERIAAASQLPRLTLDRKHVSPTDGFTKYLFRTHDGGSIESVLIPLPSDGGPGRQRRTAGAPAQTGHYTMCISSQV